MAHVFISYVREDSTVVNKLAAILKSSGVEVWLDRNDISPGTQWQRAIQKAISQGDFFIACFSDAYFGKKKTYMNEELILAIEQLRLMPTDRAWFIPLLLSDCQVPDFHIGAGGSLRDIQYVSLFKDWETGIRKILSVINPSIETQDFSIIEAIRIVIRFGGRLLNPLPKSLFALALLIVVAYFLLEPRLLDLSPISSSVVVISKGTEKFIYVAASDQGEIQLMRATELSKPYARIPVGTSGNIGERGRPEQMIAVKHGQSYWVFVTDTKLNKVHVIEGDAIIGSFSVGLVPKSLAVTPDGRKLFVSNEQTVPTGTIQAFNIDGSDPNRFVLAATISVNCPEGLALSPRGDKLYVATQCGGKKDPVFIINTVTNKIEKEAIPNLAVGTAIAVSADGTRLYVSRGNYPCKMRNGEDGSPLSIVDPQSKKIVNTICLKTSVGPVAISRDKEGRYLLVGNGDRMTVFDRKALDASDESLNEISLGSGVSGIGVAEDNSVYAFVPEKALLYLYNPQGL